MMPVFTPRSSFFSGSSSAIKKIIIINSNPRFTNDIYLYMYIYLDRIFFPTKRLIDISK